MAPTCESRFKAPVHTAPAGEAFAFGPQNGCEIAQGVSALIYFIHGPDRLLAREAARAIADDLDPEGINTSWLDGRETSLESLIAAIGSASFFGNTRVVIVVDFLGRGSRESSSASADSAEENGSAKTSPSFAKLIAATPEDHHLIFLEPSLLSAPAALKSLSPKARIISGEPPRGAALVSWIVERAAGLCATIDRRTAQHLAETLFPQTWDRKPNNPRYDRPPDLALIAQELDKLTLTAHPGAITAAHIAALVHGGPDQRIFRFLDAALGGDLRGATIELERLAAAGDDPAMVLSQALGQLELAAVVTAAEHRDTAAIARDLGSISASRVSAVASSAQRLQARRAESIRAGVAADRKLKSGHLRRPADALHELIAVLAGAERGQEIDGPY